MTLKSKNYLIFQIAIPIVTFIVMALSHIIYPPSFVLKNEILKAAAVFSINLIGNLLENMERQKLV